jgi:hypothetical protein
VRHMSSACLIPTHLGNRPPCLAGNACTDGKRNREVAAG